MESKSCSPSSRSPSRQAGWSGLSNSETWKTGATPSSLHVAQTGSKSACESGFPSTGAGAIMARRMPSARTRRISSTAHAGSWSSTWATPKSRPPPSEQRSATKRL